MLYNILKISHILSASFLIIGVSLSIKLWYSSSADMTIFKSIQNYTAFIIIPTAIFQLLTGFMMISLEHYNLSQIWIKDSTVAFIIAIGSWFGFLYLMLTTKLSRYLQYSLLILCLAAMLAMIFLMANKI